MNKNFLNTPGKEYTLQKVSNGNAGKAVFILILSHLLPLVVMFVFWSIYQGYIFNTQEKNEYLRTLLGVVNLFIYILSVSASLSYFGFNEKNRSFTDSQLKSLKKLRIGMQLSLVTVGLYFILSVAN